MKFIKKRKLNPVEMLSRYLLILILGSGSLYIFYSIFTRPTIFISFALLKIFYPIIIVANTAIFQAVTIALIPACVAGAAYYLLLILNLATPMELKTRVFSLVFLFATFFVFNVIRIVLFAVLAFEGYQYFDIAHKAVWYFGSTVLVVALWFVNASIFKIKEIPIYTDIKQITAIIKHPYAHKNK